MNISVFGLQNADLQNTYLLCVVGHVCLSVTAAVSISGLTSERESTREREDVAIYNLPMSVCVC